MNVGSLHPSFDPDSLSLISVIIFNMLGFEVICTIAGDMENPKKQIPKAIIIGGTVIAPFIPNEDMFWSFFALILVMFLMSYHSVLTAFYKMRKIDSNTERPLKVSGSDLVLNCITWRCQSSSWRCPSSSRRFR